MASGLLNRLRRVRSVGAVGAPIGDRYELLSADMMAALQRLAISAPRVQRGTFAGEHRSKRRGTSPEFADFKSYSPGDDIRRVDWNLYARFDELFVRLSEVTTDLTVHIVVDASSSMDWRGLATVPTKFRFAQQIAAALGYVSLWHFDRIRVSPFAESIGQSLGPVQGRMKVGELITYLEACRPGGTAGVAGTLERYAHGSRAPGFLVILSDLLSDEINQVGDQIKLLRSRGWDIAVVHVLDPSEIRPDVMFGAVDNEATTLEDSETGQSVMILPGEATFDRYLASFEPWMAEIREQCGVWGATYLQLSTDQQVDTVVLRLLHEFGIVA